MSTNNFKDLLSHPNFSLTAYRLSSTRIGCSWTGMLTVKESRYFHNFIDRVMTGRVKKDRFILYSFITIVYLFVWIHIDFANYPENLSRVILNNCWQFIFVVGLNVLYFEYALPYVLSTNTYRVLTVLLSLLMHLLVFVLGYYAWLSLGTMIGVYHPYGGSGIMGFDFLHMIRFTISSFLLFASFKLFFDYTRFKYEEQQIRLGKKQAELTFLRSQVNPHFLFNTLNNIYSLSQYEPQLVSESVLRLSKILRYILYETDNEFIAIDKEIKIINDYLDLERLRYSESVTIDFKHEIEHRGELVPPLLLLPLIENAFKHGVSESRGKRFVEVRLTLQKRQLHFIVTNSTDNTAGKQEIKENIGLTNLRRRLDLLYKEFDVTIEQKDIVFTVVLNINLATHV